MKGKETERHGMQAIIQQDKGMCMACAGVCGHDSEKKTLITSGSMYTWHVHVWWHSNCVKQSIYHSKGMYNAQIKQTRAM